MKELIFVTGNDNKAREAAAVLGVAVRHVKLELEELQSMDLRVIVEHKARQAYEKIKQPVIIEDVSFEIKAWNGFPGPLIKWLHSIMGYDTLCRILGNDRRVDWLVMYGYYDGERFIEAVACVSGTIAEKPREGGWGFDVIFIPDGQTKTLGELGAEGKIEFSARAQALKKMSQFLKT